MSSNKDNVGLPFMNRYLEGSSQDDMKRWESLQVGHHLVNDGLAAELNKLSIQERERILHDIHGVSDEIVETPELVEGSLEQMESLLQSKRISKSVAYEKAETQNPSYVQDRRFRLLFLRAEEFHVDAATKRMQNFMTRKCELFGEDKLCQSISLEDMNVDDLVCLENGHSQFLQRRDQAGRVVHVIASKHIRYAKIENELRQMYYQFMAALEDEETQKKGVIVVPYGIPKGRSPSEVWQVNTLMSTLPYKVQGFHIARPEWGVILNWMSSILENRSRLRIRSHSGTYMEVLYSLMTFGIPTTDFPIIGDDGQLVRGNHLKWIETRRQIELKRKHNERVSSINRAIFLPTNKDILFGRGRPFQEHPGNIRFSLTIESLRSRYEELRRNEKTGLAEDVVEKMKARGSRFLRLAEGCWEEVNDSMAREKVSQAFRSLRPGKQGEKATAAAKAPLQSHRLNRKRDSMD